MTDTDPTTERREGILDAAAEVFDRQGYAATTMEEVASAAGISKGSIYNYFQSKSDLFAHLLTRALEPETADAAGILRRSGPATKRIEALIDMWFSRMDHYKELGRLTLEFWSTAARQPDDGRIAGEIDAFYQTWQKMLTNVFTEGDITGEFHAILQPRGSASLLLALLDGLMLHLILGVGVDVNEELRPVVKRAVMAALGTSLPEHLPPAGGAPTRYAADAGARGGDRDA